MILSFSDLIWSITLFINGAAVLDFTLKPGEDQTTVKAKIYGIINAIQLLRYLIVVWNIVLMLFMLW